MAAAKTTKKKRATAPPQFGFIDRAGKPLGALRFDQVKSFSEGFAWVRQGARWGALDKTGSLCIEPRFELVGPFSEGLAPVCEDGKSGYIDTRGEWVIAPRFDFCFEHNSRYGVVCQGGKVPSWARDLGLCKPEGGKWGAVDIHGNLVLGLEFDRVEAFSDDCFAVLSFHIWRYVTADGADALDARFVQASPFSQGIACVRREVCGATDIIDRRGTVIGRVRTGTIVEPFSDERSVVLHDGRSGTETQCSIIDSTGREILTGLAEATRFNKGICAVNAGGTCRSGIVEGGIWNLVDRDGHTIATGPWTNLRAPAEGLIAAADATAMYGFVSPSGAWCIEAQFPWASGFSQGFAAVKFP